MSKSKSITKNILCLLLIIFMAAVLAGCDDDNTGAGGSGSMEDPYAAYGLERGKSYDEGDTLEEAMRENPPAAILLQPAFYYRAYYEPVPQSGEILLEKGKSINIPLDLDLIHTSGGEYNIKSDITLKYDGKKGEDLFHADTSTYGNPTLYIDGKYISEYRNHVVKNKASYLQYFEPAQSKEYSYNFEAPEEFLYITLGVDKGEASKADGNIGFLYLRIIGVKR